MEDWLKELIRYDFEIVNAEDTISKVFPLLDKLDQDKAGAILVMEDGKVYGVVREKDLLRTSVLVNPHETKVKSAAIKTGIINVSELTLEKVLRRFIEDSTPFVVVKENGKYGVIYINDLLEALKDRLKDKKARDVMNPNVVTINAHESAAKALALMRTNGIDRLVVVDDSHRVVGVITGKDIIDRIVAPRRRARLGEEKGEKDKTLSIMVESIMSYPPVTAERMDSLADIVEQMLEHKVSSVVIVSKDNIPEGIVTKKDILESLIREAAPSQLKVELVTRDITLDEFDKEAINKDLENFMRKFGEFLGESYMFVYIKRHKDVFRALPLIHVRMKLTSERGTFFASGEGWGVEYAIHATLKKLEREILKEKELLLDHKMIRRFYEEVLEF
ncbi:putative signal transduction protein with CBS domains [Ferroglobus placidus DSM 10642]|uniref:Putative signal transduction protein with CBS domains n=1 Tax=Ferroglobus placidus (strain DSM 10642 / AEDII12DO) TaxID=589924 RepID=D3S0M0_FERPA|nr:CBS domain-containing protein [Ferroglobus placidus]ADC66261.1 putative signal transduction protein with CBS domains [Ferroglobus placidus DSM 10642]